MNKQLRPKTTLFMLMSVDGRISTGENDLFDFDRDLKLLEGTRKGLYQYYDAEQSTDLWSFNTGVVMNKIGVNSRLDNPIKSKVSFIIVDNKPHLTKHGIDYQCKWLSKLVILTTNPEHPALVMEYDNLTVIKKDKLDFNILFSELYHDFGIQSLTIQSGSTMNSLLVRSKLIDELDLFVSPILIGGTNTPSLIGGKSFSKVEELSNITTLELKGVKVLNDSYVRLKYKVLHTL